MEAPEEPRTPLELLLAAFKKIGITDIKINSVKGIIEKWNLPTTRAFTVAEISNIAAVGGLLDKLSAICAELKITYDEKIIQKYDNIKILSTPGKIFHISEIKIFNTIGIEITKDVVGISSMSPPPPGGYGTKNLYDNDFKTYVISDRPADTSKYTTLDIKLLSPQLISAVYVFNRQDCCQERLVGSRIEISGDFKLSYEISIDFASYYLEIPSIQIQGGRAVIAMRPTLAGFSNPYNIGMVVIKPSLIGITIVQPVSQFSGTSDSRWWILLMIFIILVIAMILNYYKIINLNVIKNS